MASGTLGDELESQPIGLSALGEIALRFYDAGFNVMPLAYGEKYPIGKWGALKKSRLSREGLERYWVDGKCNIGILTGKNSNNLLVVDCDDPQTFKQEVSRLEDLGLAKWVVESARGGHIWLRSDGFSLKPLKDGPLEIKGENQYIVVPPSRHPTGVIYLWQRQEGDLPPLLKLETLKRLFPSAIAYRPANSRLPEVVEKVLLHKDITGYPSNSEAEFAAVTALVRTGCADDEIVEMFEKYLPAHYATKPHREAWIEKHMIAKARTAQGVVVARSSERSLMLLAESFAWKGRTGTSDKKVFLACCQRAELESRSDFRASERELEIIAGVDRKTVRRALKRLCEIGLINKVETSDQTGHYAICGDGVNEFFASVLATTPSEETKIVHADES